ncbi:hypothetical protein WMY93_008676 [Mugilogobius chulae]|uniref:ribonuclease H n=1 Tax=Mugilogobius chulae TaxID=88201 RepID=A0AAW0PFS6_9GOBI
MASGVDSDHVDVSLSSVGTQNLLPLLKSHGSLVERGSGNALMTLGWTTFSRRWRQCIRPWKPWLLLNNACLEAQAPRRGGFHPDAVSLAASGNLDKTDSSGCGSSALLDDFGEQDVLVDDTVGEGLLSEAGDFSVASLLARAAATAGLPALPTPPKASALDRGLGRQSHALLPVYPDFVSRLQESWARPREATLPRSALAMLHDATDQGLDGILQVGPSFALLAGASPSGRVTRHPNRKCRATDGFVAKAYQSAAMAARLANTTALLLVYLEGLIRDLDSKNPSDLLPEMSNIMDTVIQGASVQAKVLGNTMAHLTMARRHVWLSQTALSEAEHSAVLGASISPGQVFGPAAETALDEAQKMRMRSQSMRHQGLLKSGPQPAQDRRGGPQRPQAMGQGSSRDFRSGRQVPLPDRAATEPTLVLGSVVPEVNPGLPAHMTALFRWRQVFPAPNFGLGASVLQTKVGDKALSAVLTSEISALLSKRAIRPLNLWEVKQGFYSPYFLVPKRTGGFRPILDLRRLNRYLKVLPFHMLRLKVLFQAIRAGDWFTTVDLRDAYFHVPIDPAHRRYLRFAFNGMAYEYNVLPFGLSLSPRTFTKCMDAALSLLRRRGIRVLNYLDDWLVCAPSLGMAHDHTAVVLAHLASLGLHVNSEKSRLVPSQSAQFLGLLLNSVSMRACLTPTRVSSSCASRAVAHTTTLAVVCVSEAQNAEGQTEEVASVPQSPQCAYVVGELQGSCRRSSLGPWCGQNHCHNRCLPDRLGRCVGGQVCARHLGLSATSLAHKSPRMEAVYLALHPILPVVRGRQVLVKTDSTAVVSYINHQGGLRSPSLHARARQLLLWAQSEGVSLRAFHLPGPLNTAADLLSRGAPHPGEWRLHTQVVSQIWCRFGQALVDLFATEENSHCPLWFSMTGPPGPLGTDAMSQIWPLGVLYAFPPLPLLPALLSRIRLLRAQVLLVAPNWPQRPWMSEVSEMLDRPPWRLPDRPDLLTQHQGRIWHPRPKALNLHHLLDQGRSESTLRGYLAAISVAHELCDGVTPGSHPLATQFLKGARRQRPTVRRGVPPFGDRVVHLLPSQAFLPKVLPRNYVAKPLVLSSFCPPPHSCVDDEKLHCLCPVRALRAYVDRTSSLRSTDNLFVSYSTAALGKPVTKQRLSHWLVDLIAEAYSHLGEPPPQGVVAHSTRGMAASWALFRGVPLEEVCSAAGWASSSTFVKYYRLDLPVSTIPSAVLGAAMDG